MFLNASMFDVYLNHTDPMYILSVMSVHYWRCGPYLLKLDIAAQFSAKSLIVVTYNLSHKFSNQKYKDQRRELKNYRFASIPVIDYCSVGFLTNYEHQQFITSLILVYELYKEI